ncbi:GlxA family transcriptional regulator [Parachitinimonas caeni]|uniref:Helix-turn-helix domain-containing protein n=1 Tax=Parachitinimonas caeni TaxID=3031301 RepID=A0ABT7DT01_9NEIS|nr:helix-turn-helix domain-containing protein [Parachitinimonas caeni]MDK2123199.1 helix-turn-helix domain-containing protein [Parachitinimonas caeni]
MPERSELSPEVIEWVFLLLPGVILLDVAGPADALRIAASHGAPYRLRFVGPSAVAHSSIGLGLSGCEPLPDRLPDCARIVVPGVSARYNGFVENEAAQARVWLQSHGAGGRQLVTVCAGALLAAEAGLLAGRRCTTHHSLIEELVRREPLAKIEEDRIFVEDGPIATSAGITSGIDLALHLIAATASPQIAATTARELVVYLRRGGGDPQLSPWLEHRNHLHRAVHKVQDIVAREPQKMWSVTELADLAHVSARHLSRLFSAHAGIGLVEYRQKLQLAYAADLLQHGRHSIERVAELAGFASGRDFRRVWGKHRQDTPSLFRVGKGLAGAE